MSDGERTLDQRWTRYDTQSAQPTSEQLLLESSLEQTCVLVSLRVSLARMQSRVGGLDAVVGAERKAARLKDIKD